MKEIYKIGIDIGGTNTDAVIIDRTNKIITSCKIPTEKPLENGVNKGLLKLLQDSGIDKSAIKGIYIGTTHATNAVLEAKGLSKVGVLRLAGQRPITLDPCFRWPEYIRQAIFAGVSTVSGGYRCDMKEISSLSKEEIQKALVQLSCAGMESLAIAGVFSPLSPHQEIEAKKIAQELLGSNFSVTISSDIGGMGFVERENAAILNAALKKLMGTAFQNMELMKQELGITAPLFVTQNDGSMIDLSQAMEKPLLTISSGPTNSFIGAVKLMGLNEAIIVDIGGTSVDIGVVLSGYPRRSLGQASVGGIPLNFRMPDVMSLPIGGGSVVKKKDNVFTFGPDSLGSKLFEQGCLFGGQTLTLTDAACKAGLFSIPAFDSQRVPLSHKEAEIIMEDVISKIQAAIHVMRGSRKDLPILAVGGGAYFLQGLADAIPKESGVANAYGASLAEISYTVDTVVSLQNREQSLANLSEEALKGAKAKGAGETSLRIVDVQVIPYHYIPNKLGRVVITASGRCNC
jgi:N-methylhydantoinase A/oxoprolinase/acetone carboxylase beta subunit